VSNVMHTNIEPTTSLALAIRRHAVRMTNLGNSSHVGAVLSIADILAVLYGRVLRKRPAEPKWPERDRFILSKGHAGAGVYAILADTGYFDPTLLTTHYQDGSKLSGHVSHAVPGVEFSTGSLVHGLSVGAGMAYISKMEATNYRTFVLLGDGECDEGSVWEAALFAAHHQLSNLIVIIDFNKIQSLGSLEETLRLEPFADKWRSFGFTVKEVNGHSIEDLITVLDVNPEYEESPVCILAHTVKGKGVSFMENSVLWHYRSPQGDEYRAAMKELGI